jgi:hypothetical protein
VGEPLLRQLTRALEVLWEEGSPVAGKDAAGREGQARLALRRWRSFGRRHRGQEQDRERQVEDLAKGLRDACEPERETVGPLMADYRHAARVLATVLDPA